MRERFFIDRIMLRATMVMALSLTVKGYASAADNTQIVYEIDSIIKNTLPAGTDICVSVYDLAADSAIYGYRENTLGRPASTMKVLTAYTAMAALGKDYNFVTSVCTTDSVLSDSILRGDLYLIGGFDPELMETDLRRMAHSLKEQGITKVDGRLLADVSAMDSTYWGSGWAWDDTPSSFQPYVSPLICHGGFVGISVKPTTPGEAPTVKVYPESSFYTIQNNATTIRSGRETVKITRNWMENGNTIIVDGNIRTNQSTELNIFDPDLFTLYLFKEYLEAEGITVEGMGRGKAPEGARVLTSTSRPLRYVMKEALKESKNLNAEAMMLATAYARYNSRISFKQAVTYQSDYLKRATKDHSRPFNIADGSGLSMYDYIPAAMFTDILKLIYGNSQMFDIIYDAMPVNGYDGTLRGRMTARPLVGKVHAKTGSITGACTLAGYATGNDGRLFAFAILNEGAITMAASRRVQDAICTVLCK